MTEQSDDAAASVSRFASVFDLCLLWPIRLTATAMDGDPLGLAGAALAANNWELVADPLVRGGSTEDDGFAVAELAFFHTFAQRLLYGDRGIGERPFEIYRYRHSPGATLAVRDSHWSDELSIVDHRFYLIDNSVAIMALDLTASEPKPWSHVLNAICYLRTVYFQHYQTLEDKSDQSLAWVGGGAPEYVRVGPFGNGPRERDRTNELRSVLKQKKSVLLDHWRDLVKPLTDAGIGVEPIGDHRMAVMAFVATPDPETLTDDEWFALGEADGAGFMRYAERFRASRLEKMTYDRWWANNSSASQRDRWIVGSLTLVRVTAAEPGPAPAWLNRTRKSWWRQYFQIFFLAHFQRVALTVLQTKVAEATPLIPDTRRLYRLVQLRASLEEIEREMANFSSRFWFREVSPQVQGQDLFALLRGAIGLESLYSNVIKDKTLLTEWARTRYWELINTWVVPAGLFLAIASAFSYPLQLVARGMGQLVYRIFPLTASLLTGGLREAVAESSLVVILGVLFLLLWRTVWRREK